MNQAQWTPEWPVPPPVSLASQSHHEKPPEVTCTSRGNPGMVYLWMGMQGASLVPKFNRRPINISASGVQIFRFWQNKKSGLGQWITAYCYWQ